MDMGDLPLLLEARVAGGVATGTVTLDWERRQRTRLRARLDDGREAAIRLPRGSGTLRDGDLLRAVDGTLITVRAAAEALSVVEGDGQALIRACYHLANRHVPLALMPGRLCWRHDHVLDVMVGGLGHEIRHEAAPFEAEGGAWDVHDHAARAADEEAAGATVSFAHDGPSASVLLSLLRLTSSGLPIGSFAYSQGLEQAVECGWVSDEAGVAEWVEGLLHFAQAQTDVPLLARLHGAFARGDIGRARYWNARVLAARDGAEARAEERDTGHALARLLPVLKVESRWREEWGDPAWLSLYAMVAAAQRIPLDAAAQGWLWNWGQQQVAAALRLLPLGQTAGQRILGRIIDGIPAAVSRGLALADEEILGAPPGLAFAAARHETQYTRLFLS
jgi:urease accessory protein